MLHCFNGMKCGFRRFRIDRNPSRGLVKHDQRTGVNGKSVVVAGRVAPGQMTTCATIPERHGDRFIVVPAELLALLAPRGSWPSRKLRRVGL